MALTTYGGLMLRQAENEDSVTERRRNDLLVQACAGDSVSFALLFDLYTERVYQFIYFNVADEQTAEDLTARVFVKAWRSIACYKPERTPFAVWLYLLARNAVREHVQAQHGSAQVREIVSLADEGLEAYEIFEPCEPG